MPNVILLCYTSPHDGVHMSGNPPENLAPVDEVKRSLLKKTSVFLGALGLAGIGVPLLSYLSPNRSTREAGKPISVDVSGMKIGEQKTVLWRSKPVWIIRRSEAMLASLGLVDGKLKDPGSDVAQQPVYARNEARSIRPDFLVLLGICTHLGCSPTYRPDPKSVDDTWAGGFYCSCHGSKFDLAGRVFKNMPAPSNLEVPPYHFSDENTLVIGDGGA